MGVPVPVPVRALDSRPSLFCAMQFAAWAFTIVGLAQMSQWALQKHKGYIKASPEYKRLGRKAIIPFVL